MKYKIEVINCDGSASESEEKEFPNQEFAENYAGSWAAEYDNNGRWYLYDDQGKELATQPVESE